MTWTQFCNAWWNYRPLSLTSSVVDNLIIVALPHIHKGHHLRLHFERILNCTGQLLLLPKDDNNNSVGNGDIVNNNDYNDGNDSMRTASEKTSYYVDNEMVQRLPEPDIFPPDSVSL